MHTVFTSNDPISISFAKSILSDVGITFYEADVYTSILEGSIGAIPRRLQVAEADAVDAISALKDNGLINE